MNLFTRWPKFVTPVLAVQHWSEAIAFLLVSLIIVLQGSTQIIGASSVNRKPEVVLAKHSPSSILVKFKQSEAKKINPNANKPTDIGIPSVAQKLRGTAMKGVKSVGKSKGVTNTNSRLFDWYAIELEDNRPIEAVEVNGGIAYSDVEQLIEELSNDPAVETVERDYTITADVVPNDTYYSTSGSWGQGFDDLWGLKRIGLESAWDTSTGDSSVTVAVIDSGYDLAHPDVSANIWTNTSEVANGIDDDGNGYIDDLNGWDWYDNDNTVNDQHGHGTHVAGTVAAGSNNATGVTGASWGATIMPLKYFSPSGTGSISDAVAALQYAADMGADISSNSWGCACESELLNDAIQYSIDNGTIPIVAAGNSYGQALDYFPAASDGVITVGAIDSADSLASFSNDGDRVNVVAPGVDILSLKASGSSMCAAGVTIAADYCYVNGTSMATPHVSGLVALMLSVNPSLTVEQVRQILQTTAEDLGTAGFDERYAYGVVDAAAAVAASSSPSVLTPIISSPSSRSTISGDVTFTGTANGADFQDYTLQAGAGRNPTSWVDVATSTTPVTDGNLASFSTIILPDGLYQFRLLATNAGGDEFEYKIHDIEVVNYMLDIATPFNVITPSSDIEITGTAMANAGVTFDYYTVDFGVGETPGSWFTTGITLQNGGFSEVNDDLLATWDASSLSDGQDYTLRLTIYETGGNSSTHTVRFGVDNDLVEGWPIKLNGASCTLFCRGSGLVFADLDGDGDDEVITAGGGNTLYAFNKDGSDVSGFPVTVSADEIYLGTAVTGDVDGDLLDEIIINTKNTSTNAINTYVYEGDGTPHPEWSVESIANNVSSLHYEYTPSLGDIDGDGLLEISMFVYEAGFGSRLYVYNIDNSAPTGFPRSVGSYVTSWSPVSPTIADVNQDGTPEIILAGYNRVAMFDNQGNIVSGWPLTLPDHNGAEDTVTGTVSVGDVDGDGGLDIVFNSLRLNTYGQDIRTHAYSYSATPLTGWPYTPTISSLGIGGNLRSPALADIDSDGSDEVIVTDGFTAVIDHDTGVRSFVTSRNSQIAPSIADFEGDGTYVVPGLYNAGMQWSRLSDLSQYWSTDHLFSLASGSVSEGTIPVGDVDNNTQLDFGFQLKNDDFELYAYLWELQGTSSNPVDNWMQLAHDTSRTGRFEVGQLSSDATPPNVIVTSPVEGSTVSGTVTVNANATDDIAIDYVEFRQGGALISTDNSFPWSASWDTTSLAPGNYDLTATAYDTSANSTISAVVEVSILDTSAPSSPTNLSQTSTTETSASFSWDASVDNVAVLGYSIYRDGSVIGSTGGTSFTATGLDPATSYDFRVLAYDAAGNNSAQSDPITITTNNDTENPTISLVTPSDGATVSGSVVISATASDNIAVNYVEVRIDGGWRSSIASPPFSYTWNTALESEGSHEVLVRAYDSSGNTSEESVTVEVDNIGPGDVDGDGDVDILDLSALLAEWGNNFPPGDFNNSGTVEILDLSTLLTHYGT